MQQRKVFLWGNYFYHFCHLRLSFRSFSLLFLLPLSLKSVTLIFREEPPITIELYYESFCPGCRQDLFSTLQIIVVIIIVKVSITTIIFIIISTSPWTLWLCCVRYDAVPVIISRLTSPWHYQQHCHFEFNVIVNTFALRMSLSSSSSSLLPEPLSPACSILPLRNWRTLESWR